MSKPPTERVVAELRGYSNRSGASEYEHEVYGRAADTIVAQAAENARLRDKVVERERLLREARDKHGVSPELYRRIEAVLAQDEVPDDE